MSTHHSYLLPVLAIIASGCGRIGYNSLDGPRGVHGGSGGSEGSGGAPGGVTDAASGVDSGTGGTTGLGGGTNGGASDASFSSGGAGGSGGVVGNDAALGGGGVLGGGGTADSGSGGAVNIGGAIAVTDGGTTTLIVDVTDPTQTIRSGVAQIGTGELDLTFNSRDVVGAAYVPNLFVITPTTSFTVSFSFRIYGAVGKSGDGFAFLWQRDPRGTAAIGALGQDLGYAGISPSVDVEFDVFANVFDPGPNDVAITTNGQSTTALAHQFAPFMLDDGATHYAWIEYAGAGKTVSVYLANTSTRPAAALVSAPVDLYATVGSSAYLGFTAACGGSNDYFAIQSLTVQVSAQ